MDRDFQELNQQLVELSKTINKFESEAVQLRIVELVFEQQARRLGLLAEGEAATYEPGPGKVGEAGKGARKRRTKTPSASGAVEALNRLVEGDFFNEKRTIGDVVKACERELGVSYKSNAFSGPLSRYTKKEQPALKREKNAAGNYVYFKPG